MRIVFAVSLALLVTSLAGYRAWGKDEKATPAGGKFPTEGHRQLDRLVGTWDVAISFKVGPGKMSEGTATCAAKWYWAAIPCSRNTQASSTAGPSRLCSGWATTPTRRDLRNQDG